MRISDWSSDVCSSDLLRRRLLAADIDDRLVRLREPSRRLQQQSRLADPRIAADQRRRPRDEPAAERTVEFGDPAEHPFGHLAVGVERFDRARAPRSEEPTSEHQSLMRTSYALFSFKKK